MYGQRGNQKNKNIELMIWKNLKKICLGVVCIIVVAITYLALLWTGWLPIPQKAMVAILETAKVEANTEDTKKAADVLRLLHVKHPDIIQHLTYELREKKSDEKTIQDWAISKISEIDTTTINQIAKVFEIKNEDKQIILNLKESITKNKMLPIDTEERLRELDNKYEFSKRFTLSP